MNIKVLYKKLNNFKKNYRINKDKIKKKKIRNLSINNGRFIDKEICDYINKNIKYKYFYKLKYKNIIISIYYYTKDNKDKVIIEGLLSKIVNRLIFMMNISNIYKDINLEIYDTPFKKKLPCTKNHICNENITPKHVNTGMNWGNNILIYRNEELLKLVIHEVIHLLDIDNKYEDNESFLEFSNLFCINKKNLLINESYVETLAIIIDIYIKLWEKNILNYKNYKHNIKKMIMFNLKQCSKLCIFYNIKKYNELLVNNKKCKKYLDNDSNVFSYHIVKLVNLYNLNKFIKLYIEKKKENVLKNGYNYKMYIKYLNNNFGKIENDLNKLLEIMDKKKKYNLSLKMSIL